MLVRSLPCVTERNVGCSIGTVMYLQSDLIRLQSDTDGYTIQMPTPINRQRHILVGVSGYLWLVGLSGCGWLPAAAGNECCWKLSVAAWVE